jgi:hypothetical protein
MKNSKAKDTPLPEYVQLKDEFKQQFTKKKTTQQEARERRKEIRELKENRDWQ